MLIALVLSCFEWGLFSYYIIFLGSLFSIRLLKKLPTYQLNILYVLYFFNIASAFSGEFRGIPFNFSWILQIFLLPLILVGFHYLYQSQKIYFNKILVVFFKISITLLITQFTIGMLSAGFSLINESDYIRVASNFSNASTKEIGLYKSIISMVAFSSFIIIFDNFSKRKQYIYLSIIIVCTIISGVKSVIIGMLAVSLIYWLLLKKRQTRFLIISLIVILLPITVLKFSNILNELLIFEGRYFKPILSSIDFWNTPFGFGMGNYYTTAIDNHILIDTEGLFVVTWRNSEMSQFGMIPVPESDLLLLSVSFGWVFYLFFIIAVLNVIYNNLIKIKYKTVENTRGFILFVFIIFSGIFQDWLGAHTTWVFLALSLSMMYSSNYKLNEN